MVSTAFLLGALQYKNKGSRIEFSLADFDPVCNVYLNNYFLPCIHLKKKMGGYNKIRIKSEINFSRSRCSAVLALKTVEGIIANNLYVVSLFWLCSH